MVFLEHRPRVYYSLTTAVEAMARFVQQPIKGAIIVVKAAIIADLYHVTRLMAKMAAIPDDCERTATVALPTAASREFLPTTTAPLPH